MSDLQSVQRDLERIRQRGRLFWVVLVGGLLLAILLVPINYSAGKVVGLMWVILSIATWMSPMMNHCPSCHKPFYEGWFPSGWTLTKCASCGLSFDEKNSVDH